MIRRVGYARRLANQRYVETGAILRQNLISDGRGGRKPADVNNPWPVQQDNVRARVDPVGVRPTEAPTVNIVTTEGAYDIAFPADTDIRNKDRFKVHTLGERVFEIIGPRYATSEVSRIMAAREFI